MLKELERLEAQFENSRILMKKGYIYKGTIIPILGAESALNDAEYLREFLIAHTPYPVVDSLDSAIRIFGLIHPNIKKQLTDQLNNIHRMATPRDSIIQSD